MNLIYEILEKMIDVRKPQKKFMAVLLETMLSMLGRANFSNMSRQSLFCERTFSRNFDKYFDYLQFNSLLIQEIFAKEKRYAFGFDQVFIPKSGKKTYGLGRFWNGSLGQSEKGIEASGIALIDVKLKKSYPLLAFQTPSNAEIVDLFNSNDVTRMDYYTYSMQQQVLRLKELFPSVNHAIGDAGVVREKYVTGMQEVGIETVGKLRSDANLYSLEFEETKGRGRPRKYGKKIDVKDNAEFCQVGQIDETTTLFTLDCYSKGLKRPIRVARLQNKTSVAILFSTDFELSPEEIVEMYRARYQIEFTFRDVKQHTGFTECQARSEAKIHHHINASFSTLLVTLIQEAKKNESGTEKATFSMASYKRRNHNEIWVKRIFSILGLDLSLIKSDPVIKNLLEYGVIRC